MLLEKALGWRSSFETESLYSERRIQGILRWISRHSSVGSIDGDETYQRWRKADSTHDLN